MEANYIRNSVKAVVDAYDGTTLYAFDETDPLLRTWRKAFPNCSPHSAMTPELQAHLRYPEDLFSIQTDRYASYHIGAARDFYSSRTSGPSPRTARANSPTARARSWWPAPSPEMRPYYRTHQATGGAR